MQNLSTLLSKNDILIQQPGVLTVLPDGMGGLVKWERKYISRGSCFLCQSFHLLLLREWCYVVVAHHNYFALCKWKTFPFLNVFSILMDSGISQWSTREPMQAPLLVFIRSPSCSPGQFPATSHLNLHRNQSVVVWASRISRKMACSEQSQW